MSQREVKHGSTNEPVVVRIVDSVTFLPEEAVVHNTTGIAFWYRREGGLKVAIVLKALGTPALDDAHDDGGILHIDDGYYRVDVPDAAFASGSVGVTIGGTVTGMVVIGCYVPLVAYDPQDAVRQGLTALPNAAAGAADGLILGSAANKLAVDAAGKVATPDTQKVDVETIKTRAVTCGAAVTINPSVGAATIQSTNAQLEARTLSPAAVTMLESLAAGTPSGKVVDDVTNSATTFETDLTNTTDDFILNGWLLFTSGDLQGQAQPISDYDGTTKFITVSVAFTAEPTADDEFVIIGRKQ